MQSATPAVSVLMSVYNGERYLDEAIDSIRRQSFADFEFIIIDDGSADGSAAIIDRHAGEDARIRVVRQENQGLVAALNRGIALARAPLLARMDCDDVAVPDRLEKQHVRMMADERLGVLGGQIRMMDAQGTLGVLASFPMGAAEVAQVLPLRSPLMHPAVMMRTALVRRLGGYRGFYKHCEDYDLWLRVSEAAAIDNLGDVLLHYRWHGDNVSVHNREVQITGAFLAQAAWLLRLAGRPDPTGIWEISGASAMACLLGDLALSELEAWRLRCRWLLICAENLRPVWWETGYAALSRLSRLPTGVDAADRYNLWRICFFVARLARLSGQGGIALRCMLRGIAYAPVRAAADILRRAGGKIFKSKTKLG